LTKHANERVTTVLAGARIGKTIARRSTQAERIIQFAIREQAGIRRDDRSAKPEHDSTIKIQSENAILRFTRRVRQAELSSSARITC
jgi:hypothetical protein